MSEVAYCTLEDVRRALRKRDLPGDVSQDDKIALDAIYAESDWVEKTRKRHFYEPGGIEEADAVDIATEPKTRDDEHDIQSSSAFVTGSNERKRHRFRANSDALLESDPRSGRRRRDRRDRKLEIRLSFGDVHDRSRSAYTRIKLERRDVTAVNELYVVNADGAFDDWVESDDFTGGVGNQFRGQDYWVRINNGGIAELYLNVHSMDDDIASLSNAVYLDIDYGHEGIPRRIRRAVALRAGAELVEEAVIEIPQNATIYNIETKADEMRSKADELLEAF